jgi:hypothetical protein
MSPPVLMRFPLQATEPPAAPTATTNINQLFASLMFAALLLSSRSRWTTIFI